MKWNGEKWSYKVFNIEWRIATKNQFDIKLIIIEQKLMNRFDCIHKVFFLILKWKICPT